MLPQEIIRQKRDGGTLTPEQIGFLVKGLTDGSISDGQIAAFAMAVFFQGMNMDERVALTRSMVTSGSVIDWQQFSDLGPVLDKHSTGGVGDKVSLMLAPIVAACGGAVPMISGRGLGHTGGTLDKLDAIPGYNATPDIALFQNVVRQTGCCIIGQTAKLAPADKRFYAIRDVTATVESVPLITASILSKKLAAGLDGLVMDVKTGTGAFAGTYSMAKELAESIVTVAHGAGMPTIALITDMNQVLGRAVGNAVEVREAIDYLTGAHLDERLDTVTIALAADMLCLGGLAPDQDAAMAMAREALDSGRAAEKFAEMVDLLGGPADLMENSQRHFADAPVVKPCYPERDGVVQGMDARSVGLAVVELGGGRTDPNGTIDPVVGLTEVAAVGEPVGSDRPIALVHARSEDAAVHAIERVRSAVKIGSSGEAGAAVFERIAKT